MGNHYQVLGVEANCPPYAIKEAYFKLSKQYGVEIDSDAALTSRFNEVQEAYNVLGNAASRSRYDRSLKNFKPVALEERKKIRRYHSRTKGLNMVLSFILLALIFVLGNYVFTTLYNKKVVASTQVTAIITQPVAPPRIIRHKKKHRFYSPLVVAPHSVNPSVGVPVIAHIAVAPTFEKSSANNVVLPKPKPVMSSATDVEVNDNKPAVLPSAPHTVVARKPITNLAADRIGTDLTNGFLYSTYIKANETGSVNIRKFDYFNSEIIDEIPNQARVAVLAKGRLYYKVQYDHTIGYVPKWTVQDK